MPIKTSLTIRKYYNVSCILYCIQYGDTILYKACCRGDQYTVDLLIKVGANIDIVNNVSLWYEDIYHLIYFFRKKEQNI